jgi:hypothetical protein
MLIEASVVSPGAASGIIAGTGDRDPGGEGRVGGGEGRGGGDRDGEARRRALAGDSGSTRPGEGATPCLALCTMIALTKTSKAIAINQNMIVAQTCTRLRIGVLTSTLRKTTTPSVGPHIGAMWRIKNGTPAFSLKT